MTAANALTLSRLLATPFVVWLMYGQSPAARYGALALFIVAMLTDVFDGLLARRAGPTPLGNYLDPVADKVLILCLFLCLADRGLLPLWMGLIQLGREMLVSGVRDAAAASGRVIGANWMGKTKTLLQTATVAFGLLLLARHGLRTAAPADADWAYNALWGLGAATTAASVAFAAAFLWRRRAVFTQ